MELKLTKGYTAIVDDNDPKKPWRFQWWAYEDKRKDGTIRTVYARRWKKGTIPTGRKTIHLHRFLLGVTDPEVEVDHKDGNGLNNRRRNLRKSTHAQNQHNRGIQRNNTSGVKGVSPEGGKWKVQILVDGKVKNLGRFTSLKTATKVRRAAEKKVHGRFANVKENL